jgi:hypothetical protein
VEAAPNALEQRKANLIFGMLKDFRHGGLGDVEQTGGPADRAGHDDGVKNLNVA